MYKVADLFAGTGAFSYCFEKHPNMQCVYANDYCKNSEKVFNANHAIQLTLKDLNTIPPTDIPKHDILCCGFSCQPFSISGKKQGFDDDRCDAFLHTIEIIRHHNTPIIIFENVKNLLSHDGGKSFKRIMHILNDLGYHVKYKLLNTCKLTHVPQNRERVYIVGFQDEKLFDAFSLDFDDMEPNPVVDFLECNVPQKYIYTDKLAVYDIVREGVVKPITDNVVYQLRRKYVRENKSGVCPTLTANAGTGGHNVPLIFHNDVIRKLTPRECFNLQGFSCDFILPSDVSDSGLYKLAGNAVSVPIVQLIVDRIASLLT